MRIQNSSTIKEIRQAAGLSLSEGFPQDLRNDVQAVINVNPKQFKVLTGTLTSQQATTGTFFSANTSATKDTYITSLTISFSKNVTCDIATGQIEVNAKINALSYKIGSISILTLTAERSDVVINFATPIKMDKGASISMTGSFTAGALSRSFSAAYYEIEPFEN